MSLYGEDPLRIVPMEWSKGVDPTYDYYFNDYIPSQDGEKIAFILNKYNKLTRDDGSKSDMGCRQVWV